MHTVTMLRTLGALDARYVGRDSLLRGMLVLPVVVGLAMRLVLPVVLERLGVVAGVRLSALYAPLASYTLLIIVPLLCGAAAGFMLLDQRDDGTLAALRVSPLPLAGYLAYRTAVPLLLGLALVPAAFALAGLPLPGVAALAGAALQAAPLAPLAALALAVLARDKLQGLALMKLATLLLLAPVAAAFLPAPWSGALGVLPTYWPARLWWGLSAGDPAAWQTLPLGLAYHGALLALLFRRFVRG